MIPRSNPPEGRGSRRARDPCTDQSFLGGDRHDEPVRGQSVPEVLVQGDVIDAALRPGVAAGEPRRREHGAFDGAVLLHRADGVGRARRVVLADVAVGMRDRRTVAVEQLQHGVAGKKRDGCGAHRMPRSDASPARTPAGRSCRSPGEAARDFVAQVAERSAVAADGKCADHDVDARADGVQLVVRTRP